MISIVAPAITAEFHLRASDIALIINAFLITYGIGQMFSGRFMDWIGARTGFTIAVFVWSLAGILTSFARSVFGFSLFRFLLGAAESGNFPGGIKVLSEWFSPKERTTAVGVFTSGVSMAAVLTPPVAAYLIVHYGWQFAFVVVGLPGLLWIFVWRAVYRGPPAAADLGEAGTSQMRNLAGPPVGSRPEASRRWSFLLRQRLAWGAILVRFVEEPVGWLFYSWLPLYLSKFRGESLMNIGFLLMIPFIAQDFGFILGGLYGSYLMKRGWPLDRARRFLIVLSAICMISSIIATSAPTALGFVLLISVATFGHGSWSSNVMSVPGDILPHQAVGTLYGLTGCGGAVGSMLFMLLIGKLVDAQQSFDTVFLIGGILPLAAAILMFTVGGKIQYLPAPLLTPGSGEEKTQHPIR